MKPVSQPRAPEYSRCQVVSQIIVLMESPYAVNRRQGFPGHGVG